MRFPLELTVARMEAVRIHDLHSIREEGERATISHHREREDISMQNTISDCVAHAQLNRSTMLGAAMKAEGTHSRISTQLIFQITADSIFLSSQQ
jgi:hypothetical protein